MMFAARRGFQKTRCFSSLAETIISDSGIATITMKNDPVNSLNLEMLQSLCEAIKTVRKDKSVQAVVLQSFKPSIFSAGLDILEMHNPDPARLREFWTAFQQLYIDLYLSSVATVAAIEGHAPAAGCMLALSCDYRIMSASTETNKPTIGLNETKLGIVAPSWLVHQFINTVGPREAELGLSLGLLYTPEEALSKGLVDEVVPLEEVKEAANKKAAQFAKIVPQARYESKMLVRENRLRKKDKRRKDADYFVDFITSPGVQKAISQYLKMLAQKKK